MMQWYSSNTTRAGLTTTAQVSIWSVDFTPEKTICVYLSLRHYLGKCLGESVGCSELAEAGEFELVFLKLIEKQTL